MPISQRNVEIFRAVMQSGTVTAAAAMLRTSQPTVSRELARIEDVLGYRLFTRRSGRLSPTAQAIALYQEVKRAFVGLDRIQQAAHDLREHNGVQVSVACLPVFSQTILPEACQRFLARYPSASIAIHVQEPPLLYEWISMQTYDLGMIEITGALAGTSSELVLEIDEVCILPVNHHLAARGILDLHDLAGLEFVSFPRMDPYRSKIDQALEQAKVKPRIAIETHSSVAACALVARGVGVSIVNPLTAFAFKDLGLAVRKLSISIPFAVTLLRSRHRPECSSVDEFAKVIKSVAKDVATRLGSIT